MDEESFYNFENEILDALLGKLTDIEKSAEVSSYIERVVAKSLEPTATKEDIQRVIEEANSFRPIDKYLDDEEVEDIMINNTHNVFVYKSGEGYLKVPEKIPTRRDLELFVKKLKMYTTATTASRNIFDVHLPNGSRANIVESPIGPDITIRNYKPTAMSIIDLINRQELSYNMGGRLWLYAEGLKIRPANLMIGGMPAAGKTTLLNAMFSFFRPESRVVVIEETYEINTETQENCVRLETNLDLTMRDLVQNALRMRPDMLIIGEVRGVEAKDMMTAMNIGKISMSTIHASTSRDVITRLQHTPMNIEKDIIPLIDAIVMVTQENDNGRMIRRISQVSEISGVETQVLLSDLYKYDFKAHKSSDILASVTYRDILAEQTGLHPNEIIAEEQRRGKILEHLNRIGIRDLAGINEFCKEYYDSAERALKKIGLANTPDRVAPEPAGKGKKG